MIKYSDFGLINLSAGQIYESFGGGLGGEPISKLLPGTGNMGGFRYSGSVSSLNWVVLFSSGKNQEWPDRLNKDNGKVLYFGDNKISRENIHDTPAGGNKILREVFDSLHCSRKLRVGIPPFFVFHQEALGGASRSVKFVGLAVPGFPGEGESDDLVSVWKTSSVGRYQNYRAQFTLIDAAVISRRWIEDLASGKKNSSFAPDSWVEFVETGRYCLRLPIVI